MGMSGESSEDRPSGNGSATEMDVGGVSSAVEAVAGRDSRPKA